MIKTFETYSEEDGKYNSLKTEELITAIVKLFKNIFNDLTYKIDRTDPRKYKISFLNNVKDEYNNDLIFKCKITNGWTINKTSIIVELDWYTFVNLEIRDRCKSFYTFLRNIISPGGFKIIKEEEIDSIISKINIDDYNLYVNIDKYNL